MLVQSISFAFGFMRVTGKLIEGGKEAEGV